MVPKEELLNKPIKLRNDLIFYLGHIPTFAGRSGGTREYPSQLTCGEISTSRKRLPLSRRTLPITRPFSSEVLILVSSQQVSCPVFWDRG